MKRRSSRRRRRWVSIFNRVHAQAGEGPAFVAANASLSEQAAVEEALRIVIEASLALQRDRHAAQLRRKVSAHWRKMAREVPWRQMADAIVQLRRVKESRREVWEQEDPNGADFLAVVGRYYPGEAGLEMDLFRAYSITSEAGFRDAFGQEAPWARERAGRVQDLLRNQAGQQITRIDETSRERVRGVLARGIDAGKDPYAIARDLRKEMEGWSRVRAFQVATYETAWGWSVGALEAFKANGVPRKRWFTVGDDRVDPHCADNERGGDIDIEAEFPSGHQHPPAHPRCRCVLRPFGIPGVHPAEPERPVQAETLDALEDEIAGNAYETAGLVDAKGALLWRKRGGRTSVNFTEAEARTFAGQRLTHNHPNASSFSPDDLACACRTGLSEIRVVAIAPNGGRLTYVIRPPAGQEAFRPEDWFAIVRTYSHHSDNVTNETWDLIHAGKITRDQAEVLHFHEIWTRTAKDLGLRYSRTGTP